MNLISRVEHYITDYVTLADEHYVLPIALWVAGTFCHLQFDAYPYLCITSAVKRSGKTRLAEMISFACSNPRNYAAITGATIFRSIEDEHPTLLFDEAEKLSQDAASDMRAILNVGYRKGQTIPRVSSGGIKEYPTYCPKLFALIGDPTDTLRDRSIIITMMRAEPRKRFTFDAVRELGASLRLDCHAAIREHADEIKDAFANHKGLPFLGDRDEEIWTPLFVLCKILAPQRMHELTSCAADMATEKTAPRRRYVDLEERSEKAEQSAINDEYRKRLLTDLYALFIERGSKVISTVDAIESLKNEPTGPWRKFRGAGLDAHDMSNLLSPLGVRPQRIAVGRGRGNQTFLRGYKLKEVQAAMEHLK